MPLSFKLILVVMGLLVLAAGAGFYVLVNQEEVREIRISLEADDGLPAEVYSGEKLLGTTPLTIEYDKFVTYSQVDFVKNPFPTSLRSHSTSTDPEWKWQLEFGLAEADAASGAPAVLHIHETHGSGTFMAGIPLSAVRNGVELSAVGGGSSSRFSLGRRLIEGTVLFSAR